MALRLCSMNYSCNLNPSTSENIPTNATIKKRERSKTNCSYCVGMTLERETLHYSILYRCISNVLDILSLEFLEPTSCRLWELVEAFREGFLQQHFLSLSQTWKMVWGLVVLLVCLLRPGVSHRKPQIQRYLLNDSAGRFAFCCKEGKLCFRLPSCLSFV